jgi:hypothetical protein
VRGARWVETEELAAYLWLDRWNPPSVTNDVEYATIIVKKGGKYATIGFEQGVRNSVPEFEPFLDSLLESGQVPGVKPVGWVHTHSAYGGPYSEVFGRGDRYITNTHRLTGYLGTPKGTFARIRPLGAQENLGRLPWSDVYGLAPP